MRLTSDQKKVLNRVSPGTAKVGLGDVVDYLLAALGSAPDVVTNMTDINAVADALVDIGAVADAISDIQSVAAALPLGAATTEAAGIVKQGAAVDDAAGAAPTAAEFKALLDSLRAAGVIATAE